jgi:hypothetical protein
MRIRVSDPALLPDLYGHLRREGCLAVQTGRTILSVSLREPLVYEEARVELDLRLAEWRAKHDGASAVVID